ATRIYFPDSSSSAASTLSLHDALPIFRARGNRCRRGRIRRHHGGAGVVALPAARHADVALRAQIARDRDASAAVRYVVPQETARDRKSTRLNSSHQIISYAVFCLKKTR